MAPSTCNTGADGRRCRLHTRHRNPKKPSVCKKNDVPQLRRVHTRCTQHATYDPRAPLAGKAWRQSLTEVSWLHRSGAGRHSGPAGRASIAQSSCEPTKPPRPGTALGAPSPTLGHPAQKTFGSVETLSEQRRDAEGAVECPEPTGQRSSRAAGSRVGQCRPLCRWNQALAPARRAAPRWRPRGGINVVK